MDDFKIYIKILQMNSILGTLAFQSMTDYSIFFWPVLNKKLNIH